MGLNTAASISFSQINSTSYFTNGNLGINTTNPTANLDVAGTINASGLSSLASITTGALSATNVVGNSISAGTLSATTITGSNLSLSGNLSVAGTLTTVNITSTNMLNTNISAGTINATGLSSLANATATNVSTGTLTATGLSVLANATVTNVSAGVVIASTGLTTGTVNATGLSSLANATATNVSTGGLNATGLSALANATVTNVSAGVVIASTGLTTGTINATGLSTLTNATVTNVSTGTLTATGLSALANATVTNVSAGVVIVSTGLTTGTINATGTSVLANVTATNVSTGSLNASTGITVASAQITNENVTTSTIATLRVSSNLLALGNSNTLGNIYTTGGNVGIGITNPSNTLQIGNATNANILTVTSSGSLGIGTSLPENGFSIAIPNAKLTLLSEGLENVMTRLSIGSGAGHYSAIEGGHLTAGRTALAFMTCLNATTNSGNPLTRMYIANDGNVGINTTSPSATLDVSGTARFTTSVTSGLLSATNVVGTSISAGTLSATTITGANLSLSGNLSVAGTLTTVNITSTNMLNTNISAGTINATGFTSLQNVTLTNVSASTLNASTGITTGTIKASGLSSLADISATNISTGGLNATNIYTGGLNATANITVTGTGAGTNGSLLVSGNDVYGHSLYVASSSANGKRIALGNTGAVGNVFAYDYGGNVPQNLTLQGPGGNVGVGTDNPAYKLDVSGTARVSSNLFVGNGSGAVNLNLWDIPGASWQVATGDNKLSIGNGTIGGTIVNRITLSQTGNVGVGTTSPSTPLHVSNSTGNTMRLQNANSAANPCLEIQNDNSISYIGVGGSTYTTTPVLQNNLFLQSPKSTIFLVNDGATTAMFMSTSGNIGIGTSSPSGMLHLNNAALFTSTGNLTCTGDVISFGSLSDRRLKKNIETIETAKALDIVSKLRAVSFDWKDDIFNEEKRNTSDLGFIAQEVEELIPEAVSEYTQLESGEVYKNIKHERLVPYLLSAIQYLLSKEA